GGLLVGWRLSRVVEVRQPQRSDPDRQIRRRRLYVQRGDGAAGLWLPVALARRVDLEPDAAFPARGRQPSLVPFDARIDCGAATELSSREQAGVDLRRRRRRRVIAS